MSSISFIFLRSFFGLWGIKFFFGDRGVILWELNGDGFGDILAVILADKGNDIGSDFRTDFWGQFSKNVLLVFEGVEDIFVSDRD